MSAVQGEHARRIAQRQPPRQLGRLVYGLVTTEFLAAAGFPGPCVRGQGSTERPVDLSAVQDSFMRPLVDRFYRWFARNRYKLGCGVHCAVPHANLDQEDGWAAA